MMKREKAQVKPSAKAVKSVCSSKKSVKGSVEKKQSGQNESDVIYPTEKGCEYLQDLVEMYFCDLTKLGKSDSPSESQNDDDKSEKKVEKEDMELSMDGTNNTKVNEADKKKQVAASLEANDGCSNELCKSKSKRKRGIDCIHGYCFQCCIDAPVAKNATYAYCPGHYAQKAKKELEDRYIHEGLNQSAKKRANFRHYEESFSDFQQTVTLWCARDFFRCKAFSGEAIADATNAERR